MRDSTFSSTDNGSYDYLLEQLRRCLEAVGITCRKQWRFCGTRNVPQMDRSQFQLVCGITAPFRTSENSWASLIRTAKQRQPNKEACTRQVAKTLELASIDPRTAANGRTALLYHLMGEEQSLCIARPQSRTEPKDNESK